MSLVAGIAFRCLRKSPLLRQNPAKWQTRVPVVSCQIHSGQVLCDKELDAKMNETPYPFMSTLKGDVKGRQDTIDFEAEWKYQGFVIFGSLSVFFLYFCVLRKEREVDRAIENTLYQGMPALEVADLRKKIKQFKKEEKDTTELEARLKEVLSPPQNRNL